MQAQHSSVVTGILAGSGQFPLYIAEKLTQQNRSLFIIAIKGVTDKNIEKYPHRWLKWGAMGGLFKTINNQNIKELVIIGGVNRPDFKDIKFDFGALRSLPFILSLTIGGDDQVLTSVIDYFEKKRIKIVGAHEIAPELTGDEGLVSHKKPSQQDFRDIEKAVKVLSIMGTHDIGQGVVVAREYVLAIEAAEGTDRMLERAKHLRQWGNKWFGKKIGVFVKMPKPGQELRIDMPAIGERTIEKVADAGLAGLCYAANQVLMIDKTALIEKANARKIFLYGIDPLKLAKTQVVQE